MPAPVKLCEHEQKSTQKNFARISNRSLILRALRTDIYETLEATIACSVHVLVTMFTCAFHQPLITLSKFQGIYYFVRSDGVADKVE